jgi:hypothetical protein
VSKSQERLIEMFAERSPEESRRMLHRWRMGLLGGGILLAILGGVLFIWSWVAGVVVVVLSLIPLVLWWRMWKQRDAYEAMVDAASGRRR